MFERVQAAAGAAAAKRKTRRRLSSPLAGKLFDAHGNRLTPTHSKNAKGTYRYYVQRGFSRAENPADLKRFPARVLML